MENENSGNGILSEQDALAQLQANRERDNSSEVEQATPDVEVEEETEELEAVEAEEEAEETEGETQDDDNDAAPSDEDTDEEIDDDERERGYLRRENYTRKTQELAEERKAFAAERQAFQAQAQQQLEQIKQAAQRFALTNDAEPNWVELAQKLEPKQFQAKQAEWQQKQAQTAEAQRVHQQLVQQQHADVKARETQALLDKLPEWNDPAIQKRDVEGIVRAAESIGLTAQDVGGITDHRMLLGLHRLAQAEAAKVSATKKRVTTKPKPKSGAKPVKVNAMEQQLREASARLKKTGSPEDAAEVLRLKRLSAA